VAVRVTQVPTTGGAPERDRREARGRALTTTAGVTLIALALLGVSNGELLVYNIPVRVVVAVGSLAALVLGAGLCVLARLARRRLPGASLGIWAVCALCLPYLLAGLVADIPGFALQVTFPGGSAISTSGLQAVLDGLRPGWYQPVDTTLSIACVVLVVLTAWTLTAAALTTAAAPAAAVPAGAGAAPEGATACDPWTPALTGEPTAPGVPSPAGEPAAPERAAG
jgi:hypothetical protein